MAENSPPSDPDLFCPYFLDLSTQPGNINWLPNLAWAAVLTAIGCVGQYLIHKNIMDDDSDDDGCINCTKP